MNLLLGKMEELLELLYQENEEKSYDRLIEIIPQLEQQIQQITSDVRRQEAAQGLVMVIQAMETEDLMLMADYLKYEVMDRLVEA